MGKFYSRTGKQLFPWWEIVSLARLHQAKRLKECLMFNKGWLLKIKRHLLKTSPSLPSNPPEVHIYGDFINFISPFITPMLKLPCSRASRGFMGEMRDKPRKTYFLKNITFSFVLLEVFYTFAKNILTSATRWRTLVVHLQKNLRIYGKQR